MGSKRVKRKTVLTASMVWRRLLMRQSMMRQAEPTTVERAPLPGCEGDCASSNSVICSGLSLHVLRLCCPSSQLGRWAISICPKARSFQLRPSALASKLRMSSNYGLHKAVLHLPF
eukprot:6428650-Amphidinium_carterae.1